jgi:hypothetical protein
VTPVSADVIESSPIDTPKDNTRPALDQVLASRTFERAPTLRRLLEYLWERRDEEISEYAIATEALKRRADFDPRYDATVRVLVSRLRQRLKVFYEEEGTALTAHILIPLGTHQIHVVVAEPDPKAGAHSPAESPNEANEPRPWWFNRTLIALQFAVILILALVTGWLLWGRNHAAVQTAQSKPVQLQSFWKQFFDNGRSTHIVVPNPIFFAFKNGLMARDVHVNDYLALNNSAPLKLLRNRLGPPTLWQDYVSASDAFSMLHLDRFLENQGVSVAISTTAEISPEALDHENVIIAGNSHTLTPFPDILNQLNFHVDTDHMRAINRHPLPGEPERIDTVNESLTRIVTPGVIASLPGGPAGTHVLVLMATYHTAALVEYLTSQSGMRELAEAQAAHGNCRYFEAVILSQIEGNTELRSRLALFRPLKSH